MFCEITIGPIGGVPCSTGWWGGAAGDVGYQGTHPAGIYTTYPPESNLGLFRALSRAEVSQRSVWMVEAFPSLPMGLLPERRVNWGSVSSSFVLQALLLLFVVYAGLINPENIIVPTQTQQ